MKRRKFISALLCTTALASIGLPVAQNIPELRVLKWKPAYRVRVSWREVVAGSDKWDWHFDEYAIAQQAERQP